MVKYGIPDLIVGAISRKACCSFIGLSFGRIWSFVCSSAHPHYRKHVGALEGVQKKFTRMLPGTVDISYERCDKRGLYSLGLQLLRGDLVEVDKSMRHSYGTCYMLPGEVLGSDIR